MAKGYVKFFRRQQEHWLWEDKPYAKGQAWMDLVMLACHEPSCFMHGSRNVELQRGQLLNSIKQLSERWGWGVKKGRLFFQQLEDDGMLKRKSNRYYSIFTIQNYDKWQGEWNAQEKDRQKTVEGPVKRPTGNVAISGTDGKEGCEKTAEGHAKGTHSIREEDKNNKNKDLQPEKSGKMEKTEKPKRAEEVEVIPYQQVVDLFHSACPSLSGIVKLTAARKKAIAARWKEYDEGVKPFIQLFNTAEGSDFLKGMNRRKWRATFDWLLKADNMATTLEGNYSGSKGGQENERDGKLCSGHDPYEGLGIDLDELEL